MVLSTPVKASVNFSGAQIICWQLICQALGPLLTDASAHLAPPMLAHGAYMTSAHLSLPMLAPGANMSTAGPTTFQSALAPWPNIHRAFIGLSWQLQEDRCWGLANMFIYMFGMRAQSWPSIGSTLTTPPLSYREHH